MVMVLQRVPSLDVPREGPPGSTQRASCMQWLFCVGAQEKKEAEDGD